MGAKGGSWVRSSGRVRCVRAPGLISVLDPRFGVGDVMVDGVFPGGDALRPLGLPRPSTVRWRQRHLGSGPRSIGVNEGWRAHRPPFGQAGCRAWSPSSRRTWKLRLSSLRKGEAGSVAAEALGGLVVVGAVGAAGLARRDPKTARAPRVIAKHSSSRIHGMGMGDLPAGRRLTPTLPRVRNVPGHVNEPRRIHAGRDIDQGFDIVGARGHGRRARRSTSSSASLAGARLRGPARRRIDHATDHPRGHDALDLSSSRRCFAHQAEACARPFLHRPPRELQWSQSAATAGRARAGASKVF